jgi:hypothetical protein
MLPSTVGSGKLDLSKKLSACIRLGKEDEVCYRQYRKAGGQSYRGSC